MTSLVGILKEDSRTSEKNQVATESSRQLQQTGSTHDANTQHSQQPRTHRVVGFAAVPSPAAKLNVVLLHVESVDIRVEFLVVWVTCEYGRTVRISIVASRVVAKTDT